LALDKDQRGLAVYLKELLPASQRPIAERWLRVDANPRLILAPDGLDPRDARAAAIVLHGLRRWSRQDSVAAAAALDVVKQRYSLPPPALAEMQRQLALFVASRGHPSALARLNALPDTVVDAQVREWRVRIHLTEPDWRGVLTWLDGLRPEESAQPLWLYWRARALEVGGQADESRVIYGRLASQRDYHGFLAADRIGAPYQWVDAPLVFSTTELDALEQSPAVQRARELFLLGRFREAGVEWQRAIAAHTPQELQKAAKLAQRWGWHHQAIMTLARTNHRDDLALRFPLPYRAQIAAAAQDAGLDPAWIYAILRQESLFRTDARSSAGALGLMQIMPATAARIAQERGASAPGDDDLLQAETSIRFGTVYLRRVLDRLRNHPALATAAYNAGPGAVARWLPVHAPIEADRWVETIPYAETRHYVKRVMEYAIIYGKRLNAEPPRLRTYMSAIAPPS
jgi:soluble lytic murein transglycosylase